MFSRFLLTETLSLAHLVLWKGIYLRILSSHFCSSGVPPLSAACPIEISVGAASFNTEEPNQTIIALSKAIL